MLIPLKKKGSGTYVMANIKTSAMTVFTGLLKTKTCKISVEMVEMIVPLISKHFTMTADVTTELLIQLSAYFEHTSIHNEEYLFFMKNYVD